MRMLLVYCFFNQLQAKKPKVKTLEGIASSGKNMKYICIQEKNKIGDTPLMLAQKNKYVFVKAYLKKYI